MKTIILDCSLMKHPYSGLYYYCWELGTHVNKILAAQGFEEMKFYLRSKQRHVFDNKDTIIEKNFHHIVKPFLKDCRVWHAPFQSGRIVPDNKKIKVVLTVHDLNCLHEGLPVAEKERSLAHTQKLIDASSALVCISEFVKQDVLQNCNVDNKPVYAIHNGLHTLSEPALQDSSYKPHGPFLFALGYVNRKKNFHVLLSLLQKNNDIELVIAGKLAEPDYVEEIISEARKNGFEDRLHIVGTVTDKERSWYLQNCYAFVHPSLAEGFGATVVEAMSLGKPLFISSLTSLPEIAGDVAFFFKSFEPGHMQEVFTNGMQLYNGDGYAQKIIKRAEEFNWETKALEYINVYRSLM